MRTVFFLLLVSCLVVAACAKPMTLSDFRFRCRFADSNGGSFDNLSSCNFQLQENICREYANVLGQKYLSRDECIEGCREVQHSFTLQATPMGCQSYIHRTRTICEQYCRQNYP